MAAVTVLSDFGAQKICQVFPLSPRLFANEVMGPDAIILVF